MLGAMMRNQSFRILCVALTVFAASYLALHLLWHRNKSNPGDISTLILYFFICLFFAGAAFRFFVVWPVRDFVMGAVTVPLVFVWVEAIIGRTLYYLQPFPFFAMIIVLPWILGVTLACLARTPSIGSRV
jgi:hypothetical protein